MLLFPPNRLHETTAISSRGEEPEKKNDGAFEEKRGRKGPRGEPGKAASDDPAAIHFLMTTRKPVQTRFFVSPPLCSKQTDTRGRSHHATSKATTPSVPYLLQAGGRPSSHFAGMSPAALPLVMLCNSNYFYNHLLYDDSHYKHH